MSQNTIHSGRAGYDLAPHERTTVAFEAARLYDPHQLDDFDVYCAMCDLIRDNIIEIIEQ